MAEHTYNDFALNREEKHRVYPRDRISCITHFAGAVLSVAGTFLFVLKSTSQQNINLVKTISTIIFGISLVLLYSASALYHYVRADSPHLDALRSIDHSMIYVLIAGSYTPVLLNMPNFEKGVFLTVLIWLIAFVGVGVKLFRVNVPRTFSTICYIAMGWFILVDLSALMSLGAGGIALLAAGGMFYTIGGVIYAVKKPNISASFNSLVNRNISHDILCIK